MTKSSLKNCFKCHRDLPRSEFYAHPQMGDGLLGKCKECTKRDVAARIAAKPNEVRAWRRRWQSSEHGKAVMRKATVLARERYPEKYKARTAVGNAVRDGRLLKMPCRHCGSKKSEAHHDDYSRPLDVEWMCRKCHRKHHDEERRINF